MKMLGSLLNKVVDMTKDGKLLVVFIHIIGNTQIIGVDVESPSCESFCHFFQKSMAA